MSLFQELEYLTATIQNGQSLSNAVALGEKALVGIVMDSGWTAADLTFQASPDGGTTFDELAVSDFTATNAAAAVQVHSPAASQFIIFDPKYFRGVNQVKVRSGTSGTPVAQGATRSLTLVVRGLF